MESSGRVKKIIKGLFNPSAEIADSNPVWFWLSFGLLGIALFVAINPVGPEAILRNGRSIDLLVLRPGFTGVLLAALFSFALILRGCMKIGKNPWICLLQAGDLLLFASFLEIVFTGKSVTLFAMPAWWPFKDPSISPRSLSVAVIVLTFIGARAIAGIGIVLLMVVTLIYVGKVEDALGMWGVVFVVAAYMSLLLQYKIPGMRIDKKLSELFLDDFGHGISQIGNETRKNLQATGQAASTGVEMAVKGAAGICHRRSNLLG